MLTTAQWYNDLKDLIEKSPEERKVFVRQHARSLSGTSQRSNSRAGSVSSDGIMDEEDEEPFSAAKSEYVVPKAPKQDVLPKRPNTGGRFPSDLEISTARGLQVPLSPQTSSESSGHEDHHLIAGVGNAPGNGMGHAYGQDNSLTHAELVNRYAEEDGVNPYTSQPVSHNNLRKQVVSDGIIAGGAGVGGAVLGAAGYQAYRNREDGEGSRGEQEVEPEYGTVSAAPLGPQQDLEQQAAYEATLIAAPDTALSTPSTAYGMAGGRSQGSIAATDYASGNVQPYSATENAAEVILDPLAEDLARNQPSITGGQNHLSIVSISQLHIPGEFPRSSSYSP